MEIIIATHNNHKLKEIKALLANTNVQVKSLADLNDYEDIIEDGNSFYENAVIKATAVAKKYQTYALADDSGIEIIALNNEPGIYSARYSGKGDYYNNLKALEKLNGITNREARFVCSLVLADKNGNIEHFEGILNGTVAESLNTDEGFGYDPIFIPKGYNETLDILGSEVKNKISHRAIALNKFLEYLK